MRKFVIFVLLFIYIRQFIKDFGANLKCEKGIKIERDPAKIEKLSGNAQFLKNLQKKENF